MTKSTQFNSLQPTAVQAGSLLTLGFDSPGGAVWRRDYLIDPRGNRSRAGTATTFDVANRIVGGGYDNAGNLTALTNVAASMLYDANNKMTFFDGPNAGIQEEGDYYYDGDGNRVARETRIAGTTTTTTYVYDAFGKLAAEYSNQASSQAGRFFRTTDHLGSTRLVTTAGPTIAPGGCRDFYPFGQRIDDTVGGRAALSCYGAADAAFNQQFTAKERDDESGLDYFGARYYAGSLGRFNSVDPNNAGVEISDPQTWNGYAYVTNQPFRFVDPDGRERAQILLDRDNRALLSGKISRKEFMARQEARAVGAGIGVAAVAGATFGSALARAAAIFGLSRPELVKQVAETVLEEVAGVEGPGLDTGDAGKVVDDVAGGVSYLVRTVERQGNVIELAIQGKKGTISAISDIAIEGRTVTLSNLHIEGAGAGSSSISELKEAARQFGRQQGANRVVIQGGIRTTGANPGRRPRDIIIDIDEE